VTEPQRYPLSWPAGWPRATHRQNSKFRVTLSGAFDRLDRELGLLRAVQPFMSSNLMLGVKGSPLANQAQPRDPGVAVYFKMRYKHDLAPRVLACDRYHKIEDNIAAIAAHIDCLRAVERYGVGTMEQAFAGYTALPPPGADNRAPWRGMLGFKEGTTVTRADIDVMYRTQAKRAAADEGALLQLNLAKEAAYKEILS
jgi:hypothetical protein